MAADGNMGVGQQIDDYAGQVAAINQQIDAKMKDGTLPQNDVGYERLKAQRDGLAAKAKDLTTRTEKAGASAPDFTAAVKAKTAELKAPKTEAPAEEVAPASSPEFERNKAWAQPGEYTTKLSPDDESKFQSWVKQNKVPWQDSPTADYDMRGYWQALQKGDPNAAQSQNANDGKMHFPDTYKTPYHKSFSNESKYADPSKAPRWNDKDQLVTPDGKVVFDERAGAKPEARPLSDTVAAIRAKYPQYKDVPDEKLVDGLYNKFYKDKMSRDEFDQKVGASKPEPSSVLRSLQIGTEAVGRGLANIAGSVPETVNQVLNIPGRAINTVGGMVSGNDKIVPLLPENASDTIKKAGAAAERAAGVPERKLTPGEQTASDIEETATSLGPAIAGVPSAARATGRALVKGGKKVADTVKTALGTEGKAALSDIRADTAGKVGSAETATKQAATEAEQRATALQTKKAEVAANQPGKAAARADAATATKPGAPDATLGKKGVLTKLQEETSGIEKEKAAATAEKETAEKGVEEATTAEGAAKEAADTLSKTLMEKEGITTEEFGGELENAVRDVKKRLSAVRAKESDYSGVLERAGDEPRVNTDGVHERIQTIIKTQVRNPTTRRQLEALDRELVNEVDGTAHNALSVKQADSLRKTINEAISKEIYDGDAVSKEAAAHLKEIGKMLTGEATESWPEYKAALAKFSEHSKPLEFIEKNPLLRKVVADHPDAAEAAVTRSQIVGKLITQANKDGREALSRLAIESPELRNAARLHFTEDLFGGPDGLRSMKSVDQMRRWLVKNESALDQFGLKPEFKDIKTAVDTAQKSVADAAGTLKQSKETLKAAEAKEADIQRRLKARQKLVGTAQGRVGEAEAARAKALEAKKADVEKRAGEAQKRLGKQAEGATKTAADKKTAAKEYFQIGRDLEDPKITSDKQLPTVAQSAITKLRDDGHISQAEYEKMQARVTDAVKKLGDTKALRKKLLAIVGAGVLLNGGYAVYRTFLTAIGVGGGG